MSLDPEAERHQLHYCQPSPIFGEFVGDVLNRQADVAVMDRDLDTRARQATHRHRATLVASMPDDVRDQLRHDQLGEVGQRREIPQVQLSANDAADR